MTEEMNGMTMIASTMPAVSMPRPSGGPREQRTDDRPAAEVCVEPRNDIAAHDRHEHEQAPHAVDDRRDAREQFDRRADRRAHPRRRDLGEVERDAEADRHRDQQRDGRSDERAVDRHERAELVIDRVPFRRDEELESERRKRLAAAPQRGQRDRGERDQHEDARGEHDPAEQVVGTARRDGRAFSSIPVKTLALADIGSS